MSSEENSNETRTTEISDHKFWKDLSIKYWYYILIFGLIIIGAIAGFFLTLNWYTYTSANHGGNGAWTFDQFSMRTSIIWVLMLFVWELLLVILPTLAVGGGLCVLIWFILLPEDVKEALKGRTKKIETEEEEWKKKFKKKHRKKTHSGESGGAFGFLVFVGLCIYVAVDGNWAAPFGTLSIGYFITRWIFVAIMGMIIFGVPAITFGLLWYWKKFGKE